MRRTVGAAILGRDIYEEIVACTGLDIYLIEPVFEEFVYELGQVVLVRPAIILKLRPQRCTVDYIPTIVNP